MHRLCIQRRRRQCCWMVCQRDATLWKICCNRTRVTHSFITKTFSSGPPPALSSSLLVTFFSAASTTPCLFLILDFVSAGALLVDCAGASDMATSPSPPPEEPPTTAIESSFFSAWWMHEIRWRHCSQTTKYTAIRATKYTHRRQFLAEFAASISGRKNTDYTTCV